ncbi:hypothetical protein D3C81_1435520 [compost metagenome]
MGRNEQQACPRQQFGVGRAHQCRIDMEAAQQGVAVEVVAQRQGRHAVLDVQLARGAGERAVAQAVEGFAETGRGDDFRAAHQAPVRLVFQDKKVILRAGTLGVLIQRCAGVDNPVTQSGAVIGQGRDAHQAFAGQALQLGQVGGLHGAQDQHGCTPVSKSSATGLRMRASRLLLDEVFR